jgi:spore maturation protein CgeB
MNTRIMVVGGALETNVGLSLHEAASTLGIASELIDTLPAFSGPKLLRTIYWRFNDRRPVRLDEFSNFVVERCREIQPEILISTGMAPLTAIALKQLSELNVVLANFQTDDPWNKAHSSSWYLQALAHYHYIFSPRTASLPQLRSATSANVSYLPFGYDRRLFYPEADATALMKTPQCDVLFAGGADKDRLAAVQSLSKSGLSLGLYGGYWDKYDFARPFHRGMASAATLRSAHANARVAIGAVRRANRDGNSMRTYELAAMGCCCVMENTVDHLELFGKEGDAVLYFDSPESLVAKCLSLCNDDSARSTMAARVRELISIGHSYEDRLREMLAKIQAPVSALAVAAFSNDADTGSSAHL